MPDIVLIDPSCGTKNQRPQLGTLTLAAMLLQEGFSAALIDFSASEDGFTLLDNQLNSDPVCVGISTVIGPMLANALEIAAFVRQKRPELPIVWGGVHPSTAPESTLKHELVDIICIGDGEETVVQLVKKLKEGSALDDIKGIGFKKNGKSIFTPARARNFELGQRPPLPYHLVDLSLFKRNTTSHAGFWGLTGDKILSLETSRGCAYKCTYCVNSTKFGSFRPASPKKVLQDLEQIVALGIKTVTINDDNFFINKQRATRILEEIAARNWGLEIFVAARSDYLCEISDRDFELMKKAGIAMLGLGIESGSNRMLKRMNKKENIEAAFEANQRLARHRIKAWFHFIYGFPGETRDDIILTYKAMCRIADESEYSMPNLNRLIPNPGTPSYDECVAGGWPPPATIEEWSTIIKDIFKKPAYLDKELDQWWEEHLRGVMFPTRDIPRYEF